MQRPHILAALLASGLVLTGGTVFAQNTWYVDNDPGIATRDGLTTTSAFLTLGDGIFAASNDDTIVVNGAAEIPYSENNLVNKSVTITGINDPVLQTGTTSTNTVSGSSTILQVAADDVTIEGLTFLVIYDPTNSLVGRAAILNYNPASMGGNFFDPTGGTTFEGLVVRNNTIRRSAAGSSTGNPWSWRSVGIGISGANGGVGDSFTISGNLIEPGPAIDPPGGLSPFTHAIFVSRPSSPDLVVGGPDPYLPITLETLGGKV